MLPLPLTFPPPDLRFPDLIGFNYRNRPLPSLADTRTPFSLSKQLQITTSFPHARRGAKVNQENIKPIVSLAPIRHSTTLATHLPSVPSSRTKAHSTTAIIASPWNKMFGGHQRSLHKYPKPKPEPNRPPNAPKQPSSESGLALHVDSQERDRLQTTNQMPSSNQGQLADFGGWPSTAIAVEARPRSATSGKAGRAVRLNDGVAPPMPISHRDARLPDLQQRLIHIPMRTR